VFKQGRNLLPKYLRKMAKKSKPSKKHDHYDSNIWFSAIKCR